MEKIRTILDQILNWYKKYKLFVLTLAITCSFLFGYYLIGPFANSEPFKKYLAFTKAHPFISDLISVQGVIADKLIASSIPLLVVWSIVLAAYCLDRQKVSTINEYSKYLAFFSGSIALIVLSFGFSIIGTASFGIRLYGINWAFGAMLIYASLIVLCGFLIKKATRPEIKDNPTLNKFALPMLIFCLLLAFSAYVYGIIKDPIHYYRIIKRGDFG